MTKDRCFSKILLISNTHLLLSTFFEPLVSDARGNKESSKALEEFRCSPVGGEQID